MYIYTYIYYIYYIYVIYVYICIYIYILCKCIYIYTLKRHYKEIEKKILHISISLVDALKTTATLFYPNYHCHTIQNTFGMTNFDK